MAGIESWPAFCRDCLGDAKADAACPNCGSTRVLAHPELDEIEINPLIVWPRGGGVLALDALMHAR